MLDYAGRRAAQHPVHAAIARLRIGDALDLVERDVRDRAGHVVGRLAKGYALPNRTLAEVKVSAIVACARRSLLANILQDDLPRDDAKPAIVD
ncbi:MAG: hypothetical protein M3461_10405 [Pseudomonadota bacterium]|nr:hypothetical protein [Pseudomonadota bacterium]